MTLYEIITAIMNASGKNAKRDVLRAHKDNELLRTFLLATYDPRINYFMKKLPEAKAVGVHSLTVAAIENVVDTLAKRKVTGAAAKKWLVSFMEALTREDQSLLNLMLSRDVRAGIAENSVLEVWPHLFYIPPYQRCASMDAELKDRFGAMPWFYVQTKSDGQFCYAIKRTNGVKQAMSRAGSTYPDWLANHITYGMPQGYVAMGELLVVRGGKVMSRKDGNGVLNSVLSGDGSKFLPTDSVKFLAWDMVTEEEFDAELSERPYRERWNDLISISSLDRIPSWSAKSLKEANRMQAEHVARGEEGTVWKNPEMKWRDCSSGDKDMMKAKVVFEADFEICGAYVHKKNPDMLGGFNMKTSDGLIQFDVGSGFSEEQRLEFWKQHKQDSRWHNGLIATCEGNDIVTSKGKTTESLFLPIFIELRLDKKVADTRERVWEQFNAAKQARQ